MPKSNVSSPTHSALSKSPVNGSGDDIPSGGKLSETALRKKKNADAQAAFRQRRANYIATLEETGAQQPIGQGIELTAPHSDQPRVGRPRAPGLVLRRPRRDF